VSTIIKATDRNSTTQTVAFNFDDMTAQANRYLEKVHAEATHIVTRACKQAQQDAVAIRAKAEAEGRRAGQAAIAQTVRDQLGQQCATLLPALGQAVVEIRQAKQAWLTHWEKSAVHVAAAIAQRLVRRELSRSPQIALSLVREALELAAGSSHVRLHLNAADHDAMRPQIDALLHELAGLGDAEVVADPQIAPGGCRVETRFGVIDQQLETQLARIEEELT
jgi:flagellar biosynthesis/type III secretory pathway protein FliH